MELIFHRIEFVKLSCLSIRPAPFLIANVDNNIVKDYSFNSAQAREDYHGISHLFRNQSRESVSFSLRGDPSNFPSDYRFYA